MTHGQLATLSTVRLLTNARLARNRSRVHEAEEEENTGTKDVGGLGRLSEIRTRLSSRFRAVSERSTDAARNMESAVACNKQAERRRSTRSSTSRNRFSSRNMRSDAFYAGVEPLSVRRALHNSAGPDPHTNSAPNSSGSTERVKRQPLTSARPTTAQEHVRRELFYTIPRDVAVSRREILRRCSKEKEARPSSEWRLVVSDNLDEEQRERPRTLPSIARRSRREATSKGAAVSHSGVQGYRKVSRQDILCRRASVDASVVGISRGRGAGVSPGQEERIESSEAKGAAFARSSAGRPRNVPRPGNRWPGWGREDERESRSVCDFLAVTSKLQDITRGLVPRPSTLPKIIHHASRSARIGGDDWNNPRLAKDAVRKEPPVYGRIRRRKTSLPSNGGSVVSLNTLTRTGYPKPGSIRIRERAVDVEFRTTTRHLRDPVPDTPYYYSATLPLVADMRTNPQRGAIYAKVSRRTSKSRQNTENKVQVTRDDSVDGIEGETSTGRRTMSRKRIIENTRDSYGGGGGSIKIQSDGFQSEGRGKRESNETSGVESNRTRESDKSGASEESGGDRRDFRSKDATQTSRSKPARVENFRSTQREIGTAARSATTLPSCVKSSRKYSMEGTPGPIDCPRKLPKETSVSSRRGKERSNYVKKSARSHVRAYSDANSGRSNSPVATSSIFGFCTGKRKVQSSSKVECASTCPTWSVETGELVWFDPGVGHVLPGEVLEYHRAANVLSVQAVIAGKKETCPDGTRSFASTATTTGKRAKARGVVNYSWPGISYARSVTQPRL
ncbi:unnamed protein product [Heterotrigona itama]|uniref:Uncharacterized protein n=1 Tax=Heterotrigona itama TaxID=395501 RepID=A0A6V7HBM0_9HYME|nr:unnamed protein product [Heterotrigona itama]